MPWPSAAGLGLVAVRAPDVGRGGVTDKVGSNIVIDDLSISSIDYTRVIPSVCLSACPFVSVSVKGMRIKIDW